MTNRGLILSLAGVLLLTPDALILRLADGVGAFEGSFLRSLFMALGWTLIIWFLKGNPLRALRQISPLGWLAAVVLSLDILAFVTAVQNTTIANTLMMFAAVPAFAAIMGWWILRERIDPLLAATIAVSFFGLGLIFWDGIGLGSVLGDTAALFAGVLYALYIVLLKCSGRDEVVETLCMAGFIAALSALPFADLSTVPLRSGLIIAVQSSLLLPLAFALYFSGTRYLLATQVALIGLLEPVLGPVWAWIFLDEAPGPRSLVGGAIVIGALAMDATVRMMFPGIGVTAETGIRREA
jgi:drug/metabolite transporter (DMT)-like permease